MTAHLEPAKFDLSGKLNGARCIFTRRKRAALQVPQLPSVPLGTLSVPYRHAKSHGWYQQKSQDLNFSNCFSDKYFSQSFGQWADSFHRSLHCI